MLGRKLSLLHVKVTVFSSLNTSAVFFFPPFSLFGWCWSSLTTFTWTQYSGYAPIPKKTIFQLSCLHDKWKWKFHYYSHLHAAVNTPIKEMGYHLLEKFGVVLRISHNLLISMSFIMLKSRCVSPSNQTCGLFLWACMFSYIQQTVGWFDYISQLSTCHKNAQSCMLQTAVRTPIEVHIPMRLYTCPVNEELYQHNPHVLTGKSSIRKKAWLGISNQNMLFTGPVSNSEHCHIWNRSGRLVCM